ncbi:hypothetical protein XENORESO_005969 [Xenotaenia resolanae]|uniref:Uncharacterized protein n=1 Tax=Xenotaenia resolanae TaxID=208358 RepID=A0ABV0VQQ6_9TELE
MCSPGTMTEVCWRQQKVSVQLHPGIECFQPKRPHSEGCGHNGLLYISERHFMNHMNTNVVYDGKVRCLSATVEIVEKFRESSLEYCKSFPKTTNERFLFLLEKSLIEIKLSSFWFSVKLLPVRLISELPVCCVEEDNFSI